MIFKNHLSLLKMNDSCLLEKFLDWLTRWKPVKGNGGFLTEDTHSAILQQTKVMIHFIKYSLTELKIPYVLPGKIQTDMLEKRFGRYRSLSGNNYNISVLQVCKLNGILGSK